MSAWGYWIDAPISLLDDQPVLDAWLKIVVDELAPERAHSQGVELRGDPTVRRMPFVMIDTDDGPSAVSIEFAQRFVDKSLQATGVRFMFEWQYARLS